MKTLHTLMAALTFLVLSATMVRADGAPVYTVKGYYNDKAVELTAEVMAKALPGLTKMVGEISVELAEKDWIKPADKTAFFRFIFIEPMHIRFTKAGQKPGEELAVDEIIIINLDTAPTVYVQCGKRVFFNDKVSGIEDFNAWRKSANLSK